MTNNEKLSFFHELISCFHRIPHWVFDPQMELLSCTDPDSDLLHRHFFTPEQGRSIAAYCAEFRSPMLRDNETHASWLSAPEWDGDTLVRIHVFGPFFPDNASAKQCEEQLNLLELPPAEKDALWQTFRQIPVVFANDLTRYSIMLHYCLTGSHGDPDEYSPVSLSMPPLSEHQKREQLESLRHQHEVELRMIRMIRDGDLNYHKLIKEIMMVSSGPSFYRNETLRQTKNRTYARAGLVAEAAIEGGIDPEVALPMLYRHLQDMEDAGNIAELGKAAHIMEEDFARQVYRRRTSTMSKTVLDCCDYINLHLEDENLSRAELARALNYSEGYLSRKFSKEMGFTIKDYIIRQRLERSKELLKNTRRSIQDISTQLRFGSHSHFAAAFKTTCGMTPKQWREQEEPTT